MFDGKLGTWKTAPAGLELKEHAKLICSRTYPVTKLHKEMFKKEVECLVLLVLLKQKYDSE